MSNSIKPQQPVQTPEAGNKVIPDENLYHRFIEKSREIFESGQEKGHEGWEKAMELARDQMATAGH